MSDTRTYVWKDPRRLSQATLICVALTMLINLYSTFSGGVEEALAPGATATSSPLPFLTFALYIPGFMWLWRISANAHTLQPDMRHGPVSTIVWFFVPFANFVMPFIVITEIWKVSGPNTSRMPLNLWWALLILSAIISVGLAIPALAGADFNSYLVAVTLMGLVVDAAFAWVVIRLTGLQRSHASVRVFSDEAPTS